MRGIRYFVTIAITLGLHVGCTKTNPAACCTSTDDCQSVGIASLKTCGAGLFCDNHSCVPASCSSDTDCPAEHPVCDGTCVDCNATHACAERTPVCRLDTDTCSLCTQDSDCVQFVIAAHCDTTTGACVQCSSNAECSGATPICDARACRGCTGDSECDSGACNDDGSCVAETSIVFVAPSGVDTGACTRTAPCRNLSYAVLQSSSSRPHIVYTAADNAALKVSISAASTTAAKLYIHAHGTVFTEPQSGVGTMLDTSLPLLLRDATFTSVSANMVPIDARAAMQLERVTLQHTKHLAIDADVVATDLTIGDTFDAAQSASVMVASGVDFTLDRGLIHGGGTAIRAGSGAHVHLSNLLTYGMSLRPLELQFATGEVQFSTITGGFANPSAPCALTCTATVHVSSSIVWSPTCVDASTHDAVPDSCSYTSSIVSNATAPPGTTNANPLFVDEGAHDYHIQPTSPARDAVDTGPATDFEGDPRPGGVKFDIGADEIP